MEEQKPAKHINWTAVIIAGIVVLGGVGLFVANGVKEKNAIERQRIEQQAQLEREKLAQEKEIEEAKIQADKEAAEIKAEAEKEAAQIKADQQAQAAEDAKIERYKAECKTEKAKMVKICDASLNAKCGDDIDCVRAEFSTNPFCPKQNYDSNCLNRKIAGLPTYEDYK